MADASTSDPYMPRRKDGSPACVCSCDTQAEHDEGQRLQAEYRARFNIAAEECVGCVLGDDGPSTHDYSYGCEYYAG